MLCFRVCFCFACIYVMFVLACLFFLGFVGLLVLFGCLACYFVCYLGGLCVSCIWL